ncbi:MAG: HD-GYP domain-containing protein [Rhodocyclaceae bacterium]|nr:HD-GYP domain-containing protein [Rhodocyclaceae bacterium]
MLKKISVDQLVVGMHLHEFCGSWMEHPFWRTRFVIKDPKDIEAIRASSIREVWIDVKKGVDCASGVSAEASEEEVERELLAAASAAPAAQQQTAMHEEVARAARICAKSKEAVVSMFQEARMGNAVNAEDCAPLVEEISNSVARNPGALISLARLKTADDYTYMHSVAVCALMIALARQLGLDEEQTRQAGLAGLLHDLGKAMVPNEVLNKPGKLTDAEFAIIKKHPELGHEALLQGARVPGVALDVCLHHHEKTDGSGYPKGLKADQISLFAKMGAVCDVYDAITSNRPYKAGWDPAESLRKMAEWAKGHFDEMVFQAFVKSLGIYPVGSLVRLESGRLGVVVEQSEKSLLAPKVKVFFSTKADARIRPEEIDLSRPGVQDKIAGREDPAKWRFPDLDELWAGAAGQVRL